MWGCSDARVERAIRRCDRRVQNKKRGMDSVTATSTATQEDPSRTRIGLNRSPGAGLLAVGCFQRVNKAERGLVAILRQGVIGDGILCVLRGLFSLDCSFAPVNRGHQSYPASGSERAALQNMLDPPLRLARMRRRRATSRAGASDPDLYGSAPARIRCSCRIRAD